jgi:hypothetical protein
MARQVRRRGRIRRGCEFSIIGHLLFGKDRHIPQPLNPERGTFREFQQAAKFFLISFYDVLYFTQSIKARPSLAGRFRSEGKIHLSQ